MFTSVVPCVSFRAVLLSAAAAQTEVFMHVSDAVSACLPVGLPVSAYLSPFYLHLPRAVCLSRQPNWVTEASVWLNYLLLLLLIRLLLTFFVSLSSH
jgi:hypothetical protein